MQSDKYLWISSSSAESVMGACKGMFLHSSLPSSSNYPAVHPSSPELHIPQRNLWYSLDHPLPWVKLLTLPPTTSVTQAVLRAGAARVWRGMRCRFWIPGWGHSGLSRKTEDEYTFACITFSHHMVLVGHWELSDPDGSPPCSVIACSFVHLEMWEFHWPDFGQKREAQCYVPLTFLKPGHCYQPGGKLWCHCGSNNYCLY